MNKYKDSILKEVELELFDSLVSGADKCFCSVVADDNKNIIITKSIKFNLEQLEYIGKIIDCANDSNGCMITTNKDLFEAVKRLLSKRYEYIQFEEYQKEFGIIRDLQVEYEDEGLMQETDECVVDHFYHPFYILYNEDKTRMLDALVIYTEEDYCIYPSIFTKFSKDCCAWMCAMFLGSKMKDYNTNKKVRHQTWITIFKSIRDIPKGDKEKQKAIMFTYLMIDENTHYVKIGRSFNPKNRERTLQSEKPTIRIIYICKDNIETELHKKFADVRIRGEWFNLTEEQIQTIVKDYGFVPIDTENC